MDGMATTISPERVSLLRQWAARDVRIETLKVMGEDMPGGARSRSKVEIIDWLLAHQPWVLDDSLSVRESVLGPWS